MKLHPKCTVVITLIFHATASLAAVSPKVIMGLDSGELKKCKYTNLDCCSTLSVQDSPINALAVAGEYIYIGLQSGDLRRCALFRPSNCTIFHEQDSEINAIAVFGKYIYIGSTEGITKCGLRKSENCQKIYESETPIHSLLAFGGNLYAGTDNFALGCDLNSDVLVNCTILANTTSAVNAITASGNNLYFGLAGQSVQICELHTADCRTLFETESDIKDIDIYEDDIQTSLESGEILRFNFETNETTTISAANVSSVVLSLSIVFATTPVKNHYIGESASCVWQFTSCPPYVVYYDVHSRVALELHVKDGKIYTTQGDLFDTDESDFGHSGSRAIFVMDSTGKIFASNTHPIGLLHHSSLMSGKPAAAAGEIKVNEGQLVSISSCSGHYRPSIQLTKQVLISLKKQGYKKNVTLIDCFRRKDLLIDLDFKKTDLYYKAQYEKYSRKMKEIKN